MKLHFGCLLVLFTQTNGMAADYSNLFDQESSCGGICFVSLCRSVQVQTQRQHIHSIQYRVRQVRLIVTLQTQKVFLLHLPPMERGVEAHICDYC
jgi:hypothetical protein